MKRIITCFLCLILLCSCTVNTNIQYDQKPTVVTTNFPLYDFARAIGGKNINIKMLIKPGTEVHSYDPLPSDMAAIYDSELFLYIGGESDTWVDTLIADSNINSQALIDTVEHIHHQHGHDHTDEHIWTSPKNAVLMLRKICERIIEIDSQNAAMYRENCDAYIKKIEKASKQMSQTVSRYENPFIVVADRFPFVYFTEIYGIEYEAAFDGCAVSTDISLKTMLRLTEAIKAKNIKTVFCTELSNCSIANALKAELYVEVIELHSAHNVSLDDFRGGITYVDIMYRNQSALERGLS